MGNRSITEVNKENGGNEVNEVNEVRSKKIKMKCQHTSCIQSGCAWQVQCGYATVDRRTDKGGRKTRTFGCEGWFMLNIMDPHGVEPHRVAAQGASWVNRMG